MGCGRQRRVCCLLVLNDGYVCRFNFLESKGGVFYQVDTTAPSTNSKIQKTFNHVVMQCRFGLGLGSKLGSQVTHFAGTVGLQLQGPFKRKAVQSGM